MYDKEKRAVIDTALTIKEYGLIALAGRQCKHAAAQQ